MRVLAAAACLFATGCAASLDIVAPGPIAWERRPLPGETAPPEPRRETRLELDVAREAGSLTLVARLAEHRTLAGEFRRVHQPLERAIPWSAWAEQSEHLVALAMLPVLVVILCWQLAWWVYGRGLTAEERALRERPWGSDTRDLLFEALWPAINATELWRWRADWLALAAPAPGPWRHRTDVTQQIPLDGRPVALAVGDATLSLPATDAQGQAAVALTPPAAVTEPWRVGDRRIEADQPLECVAHLTGAGPVPLTARCTLAPDYLARAARIRALRAEQRLAGRSAARHRELAEAYAALGGHVPARAEWRRAAAWGDDGDRARAAEALAALWRAERDAARRDRDLRRALFCEAVGPLEQALRAHTDAAPTVDLAPLEGGPDVVADRLRAGDAAVRAATALALAATAGAPTPAVHRGLLGAAAEFREPVAAWAALRALGRHPAGAESVAVLATLFRDEALPELQVAAAEAILAADPERGVRACVEAAARPAVQWVLADATGAALDPVAAAWRSWWLAEWPALRWDAATRMFVPIAGSR